MCPHCALHRQLSRRLLAEAPPEAPLFPSAGSNTWVAKREVVERLRVVFATSSGTAVDGHSVRRTGAQLLTRSGVAPWLVEWFGRWGSSAVRAYIEDARALAPEASQLALQVAKPGETPAPAECPSVVATLRLELASLRSQVGLALRRGFDARSGSFSIVRPSGGKQHLALGSPQGSTGKG